jgi:hypothetical protein
MTDDPLAFVAARIGHVSPRLGHGCSADEARSRLVCRSDWVSWLVN